MPKPRELKNILDTEKIGPLMVKMAMPVFFGMFVQTMYNVISTIFVGHYAGPLGIAGLSIAFPLQMFGFSLGTLAGIGGMSVISRALGARQEEYAEKALGNGVALSVILGIIAVCILLPFLDFWLTLIGASEAVLPYARDYMIFVSIAFIFQIIGTALLNFARAEGNARIGMTAMIMGALLSIALSAIFIVWMDLGIKGAGLAIMLAQLASMLYLSSYYLSRSSYLRLRIVNLKPDFKIMIAILSIGAGAFAQTLAGSISSMILNSLVVKYGGDYAISAYGIVQRILMFANMPAMVLGQGTQPILGYNYGAKRWALAIKTIKYAFVVSTALSIGGFLVVYFIPGFLLRAFTDNADVIALGIVSARGVLLALPLIGPMMTGLMIFQATGKAGRAFIGAIGRPVVFLIPLGITLPLIMGLNGIWYSFPLADFLSTVLVIVMVIPIMKQFARLAAADKEVLNTLPGHVSS